MRGNLSLRFMWVGVGLGGVAKGWVGVGLGLGWVGMGLGMAFGIGFGMRWGVWLGLAKYMVKEHVLSLPHLSFFEASLPSTNQHTMPNGETCGKEHVTRAFPTPPHLFRNFVLLHLPHP